MIGASVVGGSVVGGRVVGGAVATGAVEGGRCVIGGADCVVAVRGVAVGEARVTIVGTWWTMVVAPGRGCVTDVVGLATVAAAGDDAWHPASKVAVSTSAAPASGRIADDERNRGDRHPLGVESIT